MESELQLSGGASGAGSGMDAVGAVPEASVGAQAVARLVAYRPGRFIALPPHATYALIEHPQFVAVPGAVRHAYGLLSWQDRRLPLIDLNALLHPETGVTPHSAPRYALIVAYQAVARGPLEYGALGMDELPQNVAVSDEALCELPDDGARWPLFVRSCFRHLGQAVPILDTSRLFAAAQD